MREIKFRAWDNVKNRMLFTGEESDVYFALDSSGIVASDLTEDEEPFITLHHLQYMQYTGLKDKNGTEIFEGDILEIDDDWEKWGFASGFIGYVVFHEGSFKLKKGKIYRPSYRLDGATKDGTTVIGNIYKNPELLEN